MDIHGILNVQTGWKKDKLHHCTSLCQQQKEITHPFHLQQQPSTKTLAEIAVEEQPLEEALPSEANGPSKETAERQGLVFK